MQIQDKSGEPKPDLKHITLSTFSLSAFLYSDKLPSPIQAEGFYFFTKLITVRNIFLMDTGLLSGI
jgi:hypothetical protein